MGARIQEIALAYSRPFTVEEITCDVVKSMGISPASAIQERMKSLRKLVSNRLGRLAKRKVLVREKNGLYHREGTKQKSEQASVPLAKEEADAGRLKILMLPENNARNRILSSEELQPLIDNLPRHAALIVHCAYLTGMRAGEIFNLTWDKVDLKRRVIKLEAEDTKTSAPRVTYVNDEVLEILNEAGRVRGLGHNRVFTFNGRPIASIKTCFRRACRASKITNLRFHDLRHTFNTNMRKAGVDHSVIMKMTGHKTAAMFNRYNTVDVQDAQDAYQKLQEYLGREQWSGIAGNSGAATKKCSHSAPKQKKG